MFRRGSLEEWSINDKFLKCPYLYLLREIGNNSLGAVGIWALRDKLTIDGFCVAQTLIDQTALAIDRVDYMKQPQIKKVYKNRNDTPPYQLAHDFNIPPHFNWGGYFLSIFLLWA